MVSCACGPAPDCARRIGCVSPPGLAAGAGGGCQAGMTVVASCWTGCGGGAIIVRSAAGIGGAGGGGGAAGVAGGLHAGAEAAGVDALHGGDEG